MPLPAAAVVVSDGGALCITWKSDTGHGGGEVEIRQLPEYMTRVAQIPLLLGRASTTVIGAGRG
jgi:hypothetical protein